MRMRRVGSRRGSRAIRFPSLFWLDLLLTEAGRGAVSEALSWWMPCAEVHAKDESARRFYEHLGFEPFPGQSLTLYRLPKDVRAMMGGE